MAETRAEELLRQSVVLPSAGWAPLRLEALLTHLRETQSGAAYDRSVGLLLNCVNPQHKPVYRTRQL
jgi:hypothetical protein